MLMLGVAWRSSTFSIALPDEHEEPAVGRDIPRAPQAAGLHEAADRQLLRFAERRPCAAGDGDREEALVVVEEQLAPVRGPARVAAAVHRHLLALPGWEWLHPDLKLADFFF